MRSVDEFVDCLNELRVYLLDLQLLLRPVVCVRCDIHAVNILVVLDQGFYRVGRQLKRNLIPQNQVDMYNICLYMDELVVEERLD